MRRFAWFSVLLVACALAGSSTALAEKPQRGVAVVPQVAAGSLPITGDYWALIIGIDQYQHVPKLQSAVKDAQAVREVLVQRYGFGRDHVLELINGQATREGIENALYQVRKKTGTNDSVFIYYAGHGQIDQEDQIGYWVPVEGKAQSPGTFISNARIRDEIGRMKAKHVYLVADSCFSGTLFASGRALPPLNDKFFQRLYANKSRWGLTSGMNEPVTDQGKDGHSMFAYFFLKLLKENEDPYLVPSHIYDQIAPLIGRNTDQQPRSEPLQNAGDEGGQFVFRLASISGGPLPSPPPRAGEGRVGVGGGAPSEDVALLKKRLEELEGKLAKPPEPPKPVEEARARPYGQPRQMAKEIVGKDGAALLLVPGGEFTMGSGSATRQVHVDAFYMDKYEVTAARYEKFLKSAARREPDNWSSIKFPQEADRPVTGVDWGDAGAYCRWAGKRLPTEAEWEKAARGTDGRLYPWGNDPPNPKLANYKQEQSYSSSGSVTEVGSYEAGKSPYGLYDMAGNVWEWVTDWYDDDYYRNGPARNPPGPANGDEKVVRGGSWSFQAQSLLTVSRLWFAPTMRAGFVGFRCAQDAGH